MTKSNRFITHKKTITRTFRIRQEWDSVLQDEATRQGVSVNVLLNKILRKYSLYSRWTDRNNDITLPQRTLKEILTTQQAELEQRWMDDLQIGTGVVDYVVACSCDWQKVKLDSLRNY